MLWSILILCVYYGISCFEVTACIMVLLVLFMDKDYCRVFKLWSVKLLLIPDTSEVVVRSRMVSGSD